MHPLPYEVDVRPASSSFLRVLRNSLSQPLRRPLRPELTGTWLNLGSHSMSKVGTRTLFCHKPLHRARSDLISPSVYAIVSVSLQWIELLFCGKASSSVSVYVNMTDTNTHSSSGMRDQSRSPKSVILGRVWVEWFNSWKMNHHEAAHAILDCTTWSWMRRTYRTFSGILPE